MNDNCPVKNGTYTCDLPAGHGGLWHGCNKRKRANGKTYAARLVWADAYSRIKQSVWTPTGH